MHHHRLKCYRILLEVAKAVPTLSRSLPRGTYYLEDQLKRALASAILNLSEGNSRRSPKERARFFDISLASIAEVASAIDILSAYGYIPANNEESIKLRLRRSYGMIINLRARNLNI